MSKSIFLKKSSVKPIFLCLAMIFGCIAASSAQYWQQRADYKISAHLSPENHQYAGEQTIVYTNNSPDTLDRFFFHLFPNAFQPGSMMDVRSRTIADADPRVGSRIAALSKEEEGFLHITDLKLDGQALLVKEEGTIASTELAKSILPGATVTFSLTFEGQVPVQIRRSGRDNKEGVDYSMPQWYPKAVEYDFMGWHANPYVGREFHGIWGDFDVSIALPAAYTFAGTGYPAEPAKFFDKKVRKKIKKGKYNLHRRTAPNVHDFTWAADTEYTRTELKRADGTLLEFYYIPGDKTTENWTALPAIMDKAFDFINRNYGQYPYEKYAFIQGGDGGMEYAMSTLITGQRNLRSLVGVSVHELMHSWFQFILASNESLHPWMDEGFTSYASTEVMNYLVQEGMLNGEYKEYPHQGTLAGYGRFNSSGRAEPLSTHADHYTTNAAYGVGSYVKGEVFLYQLRSIIGDEAFNKGMLRYFNTWKFKHPSPNDFIRVMEKVSGQELDWYLQYMVNTTHNIDYAVDSTYASSKGETTVLLSKREPMPFPIKVTVELKNGTSQDFLIPLRIQRGHAPLNGATLLSDWPWTNPEKSISLPIEYSSIESVSIAGTTYMADANESNNAYPRLEGDEN